MNALMLALRKAIQHHFPQLDHMHLLDYKVRILNSDRGTGASVRVLITSTDGVRNWTTVGASTNIIEASWTAIYDAVEYFLLTGDRIEGVDTTASKATLPPNEHVARETPVHSGSHLRAELPGAG